MKNIPQEDVLGFQVIVFPASTEHLPSHPKYAIFVLLFYHTFQSSFVVELCICWYANDCFFYLSVSHMRSRKTFLFPQSAYPQIHVSAESEQMNAQEPVGKGT